MPACDQRWIDGTLPDPADRYRCFVFDAIAAIGLIGATEAGAAGLAGGEALLGAGLGVEGLAAGTGLGAGITTDLATGITSDLLAGGAGGAFGGGATAGGTGLAEALGGGTPALLGGELLPGFSAGGDLALGGSTGALTTGATPAALTSTVAPAATGGAPLAAAPIAPASIGELSPTATGLGLDTGGATGGGGSVVGTTSGAGAGADLAAAGGSYGGGSDATGLFGKATSGLNNFLMSNLGVGIGDLGVAASLGGLGMSLLRSGQTLPGESQVKQAAGSLNATGQGQVAQGQKLESFLNTGTLPPGLEAGLRQATGAAKAKIASGYAARGEAGSSAEAQDMQAAEERALAAGQEMALQLFQQGATLVGQGVNTEGLSAQLYNEIMRDALTRDQQLGTAIGSFASSLVPATTVRLAA